MTELLPEFAKGSPLWEAVFALGIFVAGVAVAWIADRALAVTVRRLASKTKTHLDDLIVKQLRGPLILFLLAQGAFLAASNVTYLGTIQKYINQAWLVVVVVLVFWGTHRITNVMLRWYEEVVSSRGTGQADTKLLLILRRFLNVALLVVGALLVLDNLGIEISPLLAGLGIGGLAVALALQPTLSNFFAGTYLVSGNLLKAGDFIEMEGGMRGYVVEVGWRGTRIRTPFNNLVVIPNSRLADSILTNYYGPSMEMGVLVEAGVSYSSNLARVREVSLEIASQVVEEMPEAIKEGQPWFGYERFGDSNVDFWVWVQAKDRVSSFILKSELMVRLHERFAQEGIEINYPMRKLIFPSPDGAPKSLLDLQTAPAHGQTVREPRKSGQVEPTSRREPPVPEGG